ncbi:hypothetical protein [Plantibacter sp. CFBP 13570]|uniref:hypothetical protein n=1 Tax=Plantibacter sp. CFBP 13570 TaxID=2775272 RepID=UPI001BB39150|nr:hypothetical protein [Plantibacter sp. CFBP 13570]
MLGDAVGVLLAQGLQLVPRTLVEVLRRDVLRDLRVVVARTDRLELERDALFLGQLALASERVSVAAGRSAIARPQLASTAVAPAVGTATSLRGVSTVGPVSAVRTIAGRRTVTAACGTV